VEILQGQNDFSGVELNSFFIESASFFKLHEKLTAWAVVHDEIEDRFCLERVTESDDKRMIRLLENVLFS